MRNDRINYHSLPYSIGDFSFLNVDQAAHEGQLVEIGGLRQNLPDVGVGVGLACYSAHELLPGNCASGIGVADFAVVVSLDNEVYISNVFTFPDSMHPNSSTLFNHKTASLFGDDSVIHRSTGVDIIETLDHILDAALAFPQCLHHRIRTCLASACHDLSQSFMQAAFYSFIQRYGVLQRIFLSCSLQSCMRSYETRMPQCFQDYLSLFEVLQMDRIVGQVLLIPIIQVSPEQANVVGHVCDSCTKISGRSEFVHIVEDDDIADGQASPSCYRLALVVKLVPDSIPYHKWSQFMHSGCSGEGQLVLPHILLEIGNKVLNGVLFNS